ncbi:MAG: PrsW family intramembrane metalloprotease [Actinomycetota bacterium]
MSSEQELVRPSWGHKATLWQWREPAFWVFSLMLVAGIILSIVIQLGFADLSPTGWSLSWFLMLLYAVPMFLLVYFLDLYEREPLSLVFASLLWGGFAATLLSVIASEGWSTLAFDLLGENALEWGAAVVAPPVEEILKGVGVIFIALIARGEMDDLMDGFVYGAMVGLGFTVVEDVLYFIGVFGGTVGGVLEGFYVRVIASGLYGHVLYSGLFGVAVAYFVTRRKEATLGKRLAVSGGLILTGIIGHAIWNSPLVFFFPEELNSPAAYLQLLFATAVKGLPLLLFVYLMVRMAHRREHKWLRAALVGEVGGPGIQPEELEILQSPSARRLARREMKRRSGPVAAATLKRLQRAQIDLAMINSRVHDPEHPDLVRQRAYCASLRTWLEANAGPG